MTTVLNKKSKTIDKKLRDEAGPTTFGDLMLYYRDSAGLSQTQLGEKLGFSRQFVCDVEKGRKSVSIEAAAKIAKKLKEPIAYWVEVALQDQIAKAKLKLTVNVEKSA